MMNTIKWRLFREPCVILTILLLLHIAAEVHSATCPTPCNCTFSDTKYGENVAICNWKNSSIDVAVTKTEVYEYATNFIHPNSKLIQRVQITCQGTIPPCKDLPQFEVSAYASFALSLNSCDSGILKCIDHIFPMKINAVTGIKEIFAKGGVWQLYPKMFKGMTADQIIFDSNRINSLPDNLFEGAKVSYLKIENNNFENITKAALKGLETLETLALVKNKNFKCIDPETLSDKQQLQIIQVKSNGINFLPKELFAGLGSLSEVQIEDNLVEIRLDSQVFASSEINYVTLTNSKVVDLPENLFSHSNALEEIILENNMIKHLPAKLFWYTRSLTVVDLKNNKIELLPEGLFANLMNLKEVDFRYNNIVEVAGNIFSLSLALDIVQLDFNNITELDLRNIQAHEIEYLSLKSNKLKKITVSMPHQIVKKMDLSNNDISVFDDMHFHISFTSLEKLNISRNKIASIKESDLYLCKGVEIDFRYNNISNIINDANSHSTLEKALQLYLSSNPLQRNCEVTTVLKKMNTNGMLRDSDQITFADGQNLANVKLYSVCENSELLISTIGIWTLGALITLGVIITIITGRNTIWKKIRNICNRKNSDTSVHQIRYNDIKTYDIFLSFAHQDSAFVTDVMLPKLENVFRQKVCVHFRDWVVGELIPDQIIKSVENSRMTMIILSEHFLESEWSNLEFHTAHSLGTQDGRIKLVIIVMDDSVISNDKITPELKSYIVINEHLLWSDYNFWDKLQKKIPRQGRSSKGKSLL